ncbi:hypothetical protein RM190_10045 [Paracoccus sp. CPCC 101403]|uniref:Uncharacterized protein n=2 Tax=Paracoccus broussonetiae TaxID=3075834 RepID=A0ABU3EDI6_9RHOB|nr:hypothetical protein [Paracoccus sp. CPCC 101403]MDT1062200.1 hypothetical protein [Paracoccus sp. CPCC 101403]
MPFIEVTDSGPPHEIRQRATGTMTDGLCRAFAIKPEIVTCYYNSAPDYSYGHAGKHGKNAETFRIFIKIHAFPRDAPAKGEAARLITAAVTEAYGTDAKNVIVYFIDRAPEDAFHAGFPSA